MLLIIGLMRRLEVSWRLRIGNEIGFPGQREADFFIKKVLKNLWI